MNKNDSPKRNLSLGQSLVEYVMLLSVIAGLGSLLGKYVPDLLAKVEGAIRKDLKYAYKYGDTKACGFEDTDDPCSGTPSRHPRYETGGDNFRIFGRKE